MSRRIRTLHVEGAVDGVGGSHMSLEGLIGGLDREVFEPTVLFRRPCGAAERLAGAGVSVVVLEEGPAQPLAAGRTRFHGELAASATGSAREIRRLEAGVAFDVVHTNDQLVTNAGWIAGALLLGRPVVAHERQAGDFRAAHRLLARRLAAHVRVSVFIDAHCRRSGLKARGPVVVPNGVAVPTADELERRRDRGLAALRALGIPPGRPVLLLPGTVSPWKGTADAVEALALLERPDVHLVIAGVAPADAVQEEERIRGRIAALELADRVSLVGFRDDVLDLMAAADAVLHAARRPEPFGRVPLEALSMARPLVAAAGGAVPEVVGKRAGWLYPPGDVAGLARGVGDLIADPECGAARARRGASRVARHYSLGSHVRAMEAVLVAAASASSWSAAAPAPDPSSEAAA